LVGKTCPGLRGRLETSPYYETCLYTLTPRRK
jgi:hypothetical protein